MARAAASEAGASSSRANFLRLLHAAAYVLMHALPTEAGRQAPALATVQMDTLRLSLLKVAAQVTCSARRLRVRLPASFPLAAVFLALAGSLSWAPS